MEIKTMNTNEYIPYGKDAYFDYNRKQSLIDSMSHFLNEYPFETFHTLTFKKNIQSFPTAFKKAKRHIKQIAYEFPQLEFGALVFGYRSNFRKLHLHMLLASNPNKSKTLSDITDEDRKKMIALYEDGDGFTLKDKDKRNKVIRKIYSNNIYDYVSRHNIDFFHPDNWDIDYHRLELLEFLREQKAQNDIGETELN